MEYIVIMARHCYLPEERVDEDMTGCPGLCPFHETNPIIISE